MTQTDVSRDLRQILPAIQAVLPCPQIWKIMESEQAVAADKRLVVEDLAHGRALVDATKQRVSCPKDNEKRKECYSGKKKQFTIKTQFVIDEQWQIKAISESVAGAEHDKTLSDELHTLEHLPDGCELDADKGYQGLEKQVGLVTVIDPATGEKQEIACLTVQTPYKKPKGSELTEEQMAFNAQLSAIRVRIEHCIGWANCHPDLF